ncbi:long-chain-fatty-acid--CoA ligase [Zopfochytrium polystomum]|nr:long-chain-fatty-acid--CoA ligase [Zopfochytrium polystomum]
MAKRSGGGSSSNNSDGGGDATTTNYLLPPGKTMSVKDAVAFLTAPGMPLETTEATVRGEKIRVWKNAPPHIGALLTLSQLYGGRDFLVYEGERVTFSEFRARTINLGHALWRVGVRKGDRVGICMRNYPEWVLAFFAAISIGAIAVPVNAWLSASETEYCLGNASPRVVFADAERTGLLQRAGVWDALRRDGVAEVVVVVARAGGQGARNDEATAVPGSAVEFGEFERSAGTHEDAVEVEIAPDDPATILYTSGTTGRPKGALGTHRNYISQLLGGAGRAMLDRIRAGEGVPLVPDRSARVIALLAVPLFHAIGCLALLGGAVGSGATLVMMKKWDVEDAMRLIEKERVTSMGGVPTFIWQLLDHPNASKFDLSSLQGFFSGGAPAAPELLQRVGKKFPNKSASNGYGLTETSGGIVGNSGVDYLRKPDSVGVAAFTSDVKIVEPGTTRAVPVGAVGEVALRGPGVVAGYYKNPEATAKSFRAGGWFLSGDLGRVDDEGFLYILDRAKDMVIRGGENVYCVEVENCLFSHPSVHDCAVVGIPDRVLGELVAAVVVLSPSSTSSSSVTASELQDYCRARLAHFKVPVYVEVRATALPRNAAGKVLKGELRGEVARGYREWVEREKGRGVERAKL